MKPDNVGIPLTDLDAQWTKLIRKFHALVDRASAEQCGAAGGDVRHPNARPISTASEIDTGAA
jgi:hypothetical protein